MAIIMLPNLSPSPNLYKVQSVYNNNVASSDAEYEETMARQKSAVAKINIFIIICIVLAIYFLTTYCFGYNLVI